MLKERLLSDFKEAMKNKEDIKKNTITMIRAAVLQIEKDTKKELVDDDIIEVISKEVKKRRESLVQYEKGGREDLVSQTEEEIKVLKEYLPEELSIEDIKKIVKEVIEELEATSMKDMGKVMQEVKSKTRGRADGKVINEIVKENLE